MTEPIDRAVAKLFWNGNVLLCYYRRSRFEFVSEAEFSTRYPGFVWQTAEDEGHLLVPPEYYSLPMDEALLVS